MKTTIKLGDTVSGTYHDVRFTGEVRGVDGSGYVHIANFAEPLTVYGVTRESICFAPDDLATLRVVAQPISPPAVVYRDASVGLGGAFVR